MKSLRKMDRDFLWDLQDLVNYHVGEFGKLEWEIKDGKTVFEVSFPRAECESGSKSEEEVK